MQLPDASFIEWLTSHGCDAHAVQRIVNVEQYTKADLVELVGREELLALGLRGGVTCRLWRTIVQVG
jgi:hypothetical protein